MAFVFLAVIVLFAVVAAYYVIANDFARETLDVLFPAIGAILFSLYLGVKSVWVDRPPPKHFATTVAVLHNWQEGTVRGMAPNTIRHLPRTSEFEGARLLDTIALYNAFKTIPIKDRLRETAHTPGSPAEKMIGDILECVILEWLANPQRSPGYSPARTVELISAAGAGGGVPVNLESVQVRSLSPELNPLLSASPICLSLPNGSSAERSPNRPGGIVTIRTRYSTVAFRMQPRVFELMSGAVGRDAERIYAALGLPANPTGLGIQSFEIEVTAQQSAFSRFSRQAKLELEWFSVLEQQLERDFSWPRLRALFASE